jgi:hypothetical protein
VEGDALRDAVAALPRVLRLSSRQLCVAHVHSSSSRDVGPCDLGACKHRNEQSHEPDG